MHNLECPGKENLRRTLPPVSPELLESATNYSQPPTQHVTEGDLDDRRALVRHMITAGIIPEFIEQGLIKKPLSFPVQSSTSKFWKDNICKRNVSTLLSLITRNLVPSCLVKIYRSYPKICQIVGGNDHIFGTNHAYKFHELFEHIGIRSKLLLVDGKDHGFEIREPIGNEIDEDIFRCAIDWTVEGCSSGTWKL
jgi:hypothetical protein